MLRKYITISVLILLSVLASGCEKESAGITRRREAGYKQKNSVRNNSPYHRQTLQSFREDEGAELYSDIRRLKAIVASMDDDVSYVKNTVGNTSYVNTAQRDNATAQEWLGFALSEENKSYQLWLQSKVLPSRQIVDNTVSNLREIISRYDNNNNIYKGVLVHKGYNGDVELPKLPQNSSNSGRSFAAGRFKRPTYNRNLR